MSVAVWWPAFTLGAWGTLFFDQLLTVWSAATAAALATIIRPGSGRHRILTLAALLVPTLWLILAFTADADSAGLLIAAVDLLGAAVGLVGIPATILVLARIIWPDLSRGATRSQRVIAVAIVAAIGAAAYALGANHALFLTCADFTISGNSEPPGCAQ